jgi:hypothetical protein
VNDATNSNIGDFALPGVVGRYQDAHDRHDTEGALSAFAPDARVVDDGHEFRGSDEIRHRRPPHRARLSSRE